jgi:deoxyribose-phosphate aldolase
MTTAGTGRPGDREELVRRITGEILQRLGAEGPGNPPSSCSTCPGAGSPARCGSGSPACDPPCARDAADHYQLLIDHGVERVACCPRLSTLDKRLAAMIDHTLLKPEATDKQVAALCEEAHCFGFATVCVQPIWVPLAARVLEGSRARVCTVVGFPHGANRPEVKAYETQVACGQGAREIDMVIPIGVLKSGDLTTVGRHVRAVVRAVIPGVVTKVILEMALLTREEKIAACRICREEGATFVKTSTGFASGGATLEDVRLMREVVGPAMGVKAAGGIRDRATALEMIQAGATRIGASASLRIASA